MNVARENDEIDIDLRDRQGTELDMQIRQYKNTGHGSSPVRETPIFGDGKH